MFSVPTKYLCLSQHYSQVFIALEKSKMRRRLFTHKIFIDSIFIS